MFEDPFRPIFERPWFTRMWTVQEATMGPPHRIEICCGNKIMPFDSFIILVIGLLREEYMWSDMREYMGLHLMLLHYMAKKHLSVFAKLLPNYDDVDASTLLVYSKFKLASDPRDKVFALCGLFNELKIFCPKPDYRKSVEDVYREATIASIINDEKIDIILFAPSDNRRPGLASWVPDWSDPTWENSPSSKPPHASGQSKPLWSFGDSGRRLILLGKVVDTVAD